MKAFLQWLAAFPIPVEDIARELAAVVLVIVFALVVLAHWSPRWFRLPIILYAVTVWLRWKLDRFREAAE